MAPYAVGNTIEIDWCGTDEVAGVEGGTIGELGAAIDLLSDASSAADFRRAVGAFRKIRRATAPHQLYSFRPAALISTCHCWISSEMVFANASGDDPTG